MAALDGGAPQSNALSTLPLLNEEGKGVVIGGNREGLRNQGIDLCLLRPLAAWIIPLKDFQS
jgi:hypothetical protein